MFNNIEPKRDDVLKMTVSLLHAQTLSTPAGAFIVSNPRRELVFQDDPLQRGIVHARPLHPRHDAFEQLLHVAADGCHD
jgi:hypothetical protein